AGRTDGGAEGSGAGGGVPPARRAGIATGNRRSAGVRAGRRGRGGLRRLAGAAVGRVAEGIGWAADPAAGAGLGAGPECRGGDAVPRILSPSTARALSAGIALGALAPLRETPRAQPTLCLAAVGIMV